MSNRELKYSHDGTKESEAKNVRRNLEAMREVYTQLDENDVLAIVSEVYQQQGGRQSHDYRIG